jgi:hypothetical protein
MNRSFKRARSIAISQAILFWASGSGSRTQPPSLDLVITLVYLLNRLVSSPVQMQAEKDILNLLTMSAPEIQDHSSDEESTDGESSHEESTGDESMDEESTGEEFTDEESTIKGSRYGIIFPHNIIGGSEKIDAPHFGPGFALPKSIYARLFPGNMTQHMTRAYLFRQSQTDEEPSVPRKTRRPRALVNVTYDLAPTEETDILLLDATQIVFLDDYSITRDMHTREVAALSKTASTVVRRFYVDILLCIPIRRAFQPGYTKFSDYQCRKATAIEFQQCNLAICWNTVIVREVSKALWDANIKRLFPTTMERTSKFENSLHYKPCSYFTAWCGAMSTLSEPSVCYLLNTIKRVRQ